MEIGNGHWLRLQVANVPKPPRPGGLVNLPALAVLDGGADDSIILDPALRQLEARLSVVQIRMSLEHGTLTVRLENGEVVTATYKMVVPQLTVPTPQGSVVLNPERYTMMSGCETVCIIGRMTLDELGLNLNSQIFQLARARRTMLVSDIENPDYLSSPQVALSISPFRHARKMDDFRG